MDEFLTDSDNPRDTAKLPVSYQRLLSISGMPTKWFIFIVMHNFTGESLL